MVGLGEGKEKQMETGNVNVCVTEKASMDKEKRDKRMRQED